MSSLPKLIEKVLSGKSDSNITFNDFKRFILHFGFKERINGSHHIYTLPEVREIINIQPLGSFAKAYQVKQVRSLIIKYNLLKNNG